VRFAAAGILLALMGVTPSAAMAPPQSQRPTFRAGVDRVTVTAVVRKRNGQAITDLTRDDFELLDNGQPRAILEFRSEPSPATVALLVDFSGSMKVAAKLSAAREAARHVVAWLTPDTDQVGLYAFDTRLQEVEPLSPAPGNVLSRLKELQPFGSTSLYDAIAETGKLLANHDSKRRAIVALTDGGENSSHLTAAEVSNMASEIDVPVYVIVVVSPLDRIGTTEAEDRAAYDAVASSRLGQLARWTGGEIFLASSPARTSAAAQQIVTELRHQYFIGFEPDTSRPGWHPIEVRTQKKDLVVRARSGYVARFRPDSQD
jgi:Ca-activated chloride channel family protein